MYFPLSTEPPVSLCSVLPLFTPSLFASDVNNRYDTLPQDEPCLSGAVALTVDSISPTTHEDYLASGGKWRL